MGTPAAGAGTKQRQLATGEEQGKGGQGGTAGNAAFVRRAVEGSRERLAAVAVAYARRTTQAWRAAGYYDHGVAECEIRPISENSNRYVCARARNEGRATGP